MIGGVYMYGTFWTIYWNYWANKRKEETEIIEIPDEGLVLEVNKV